MLSKLNVNKSKSTHIFYDWPADKTKNIENTIYAVPQVSIFFFCNFTLPNLPDKPRNRISVFEQFNQTNKQKSFTYVYSNAHQSLHFPGVCLFFVHVLWLLAAIVCISLLLQVLLLAPTCHMHTSLVVLPAWAHIALVKLLLFKWIIKSHTGV